jgi:hypothetical protein
MEISAQAYTVMGINIVQAISVIVFILMSTLDAPKKMVWVLSTIFIMAIGTVLITGVVNCMVYGDCASFAWLVVGLFLIYFIIAILSVITFRTSGYSIVINSPTGTLLQNPLGGTSPVIEGRKAVQSKKEDSHRSNEEAVVLPEDEEDVEKKQEKKDTTHSMRLKCSSY